LNPPKKIGVLFPIIICLSFVLISNGSAAEPAKVLILPFTIHSDKDLSFLQKGVEDMLATRLALKDQVVVIEGSALVLEPEKIPEEIDADAAVKLAEDSQADYVLFGSLTVLGDTISTDAKFFDVNQKQPVLTFSELGDTTGQVISHINLLAGRIKEEAFGRKTLSSQPAPPQKTQTTESGSFGREHPEKLLDRASGEGSILSEEVSEAGEPTALLWKTRNFKTEINGMALGDVDGDQNNEVVFIGNNIIFIYRYADRRFEKIAEIQGEWQNTYIGVDLADINANGISEIFVTSLSEQNRARSFVLEWNGTEFKTVAEGENWHFRVIKVPDRGGPILLGQKGGFDRVFAGGIYELIWDNVRYVPADKQRLPRGMNVYGLTYGDVFNDGRQAVLAIRNSGTLSILDESGNEEWTSSEAYGGSDIYLLAPDDMRAAKKSGRRTDPTAGKGIYLQQRLFITDLDNDKKKEVIVVKNHDAARGLLERYRNYNGGEFSALFWDDVGLRTRWKTRKFSGYVSDYDVNDLDNDGTDELVFALTTRSDTAFTEPRSHIVSWKFKE
jgi:TolB-like protein